MAIYRIETDEGVFDVDADSEEAALSAFPGPAPESQGNSGYFGASIIEPAIAVGSGLAGTIAGGLYGIAQTLNPMADEGAGGRAVERVQTAFTVGPKTEKGKAGLETLGNLVEKGIDLANIPISGLGAIAELVSGQGIDKASETIRSIRGGGLSKRLGERAFEETGSPLLAATAESLPTALESLIGTKGASIAADTAKFAAREGLKKTASAADNLFKYQTPTRRRIAEKIKSGSTDTDIAKFTLKGDKAVKDSVAAETIKQGFDEGVIATIKNASKADKKAMTKMVSLMERGKKNAKEAATLRPSDVAGDTLVSSYKSIRQANQKAGSELDKVAQSLKGKPVDYSPAVGNFISDLERMGININTDGGVKLDFKGSDIEGLKGVENAVTRIVKRLSDTKVPDAHDVHRMKRYIDQVVTYGSTGDSGLKGSVETTLKRLRHNLDDALDSTFPEYNRVNTVYAETRGAIDSLQDVAGSKMNLSAANSDKAVGTLLRRLLSNAQSRVRLLDAVEEIDSVAKKHGGSNLLKLEGKGLGGNDLLAQVLFVDELDRVFGPVARTSFQGQIDQAVKGGIRTATTKSGAIDAAIGAAGKIAEKARNINEKAAFKSIYELLKQ